jgi:hypothetical protein
MIKVLNLPIDGSQSKGWMVHIDKTDPANPKYDIKLGGIDTPVTFTLDPAYYMDLTLLEGINTRAMTKLVTQTNQDGMMTPMITIGTEDDDQTLMFIYFECAVGESIINIWFENCIAVKFDIEVLEFLTRVTILAVGIDRNLATDVTIRYGRIGGRTLSFHTIRYAAAITPSLKTDIFSDKEVYPSGQYIQAEEMYIRLLDLSTIPVKSD